MRCSRLRRTDKRVIAAILKERKLLLIHANRWFRGLRLFINKNVVDKAEADISQYIWISEGLKDKEEKKESFRHGCTPT